MDEKQIVRNETVNLGDKVIRGKDWVWGSQDSDGSGIPMIGEVTDVERPLGKSTPGWVQVKWSNNTSNSYRVGSEGFYDLSYYEKMEPLTRAYGHSIQKKGDEFIFGCGEVVLSKTELIHYLKVHGILDDRGIKDGKEVKTNIIRLLKG